MDKPLERLLIASLGGSAYQRDLWFHGCSLVKHIVMVPDAQQAASIERLFLPYIRKSMSDCEVRVGQPEPVKSKVHTGRHPVFKNQDML